MHFQAHSRAAASPLTIGSAVSGIDMRSRSGIDALLSQLRRQFLDIADPLRARDAIRALNAASWHGRTPAETTVLTALRGDLDAVRAHPRLRQLDLTAALTDLNAGKWQADTRIATEVAALATGTDLPAQLGTDPSASAEQVRTLLADRIGAWRKLENTSPRLAARHARAVREYLESLYFGASDS